MDWFLYDIDLGCERVKEKGVVANLAVKQKTMANAIFAQAIISNL